MPLLPTIRSIRSTVPGLNAIRCRALASITSSDAGCICPSDGAPACCSKLSGCTSCSGMFSVLDQYRDHPTFNLTHAYRHMTYNIDHPGTNGHVSAPSTCKNRASQHQTPGKTTQLTCALAVHQNPGVRMPSLRPWLQPCNSPLVVAAHELLCARTTWEKVDRGPQSLSHPRSPPKSPTPWRYKLLGDLLEVVAWNALRADVKGIVEIRDCKLKR
jgi:hypothetical protein